ncbi:catalase-like domain-containing protein [Plectosphaerella cucumerina]|uniref:Catalase-like domain-containing protein n=1 Tax=Plectosphaerella cucumerina TaxID=40658 RepID=A0A8K0TPV5_9PEZI|nr:catalase-like domain-containing protein [Plectosphaerella cucumerina]
MGDRGNDSSAEAQASSQAPCNDKLPKELVDAMQALFGKHPGFRTTHAKGLLVEGTFTPSAEAKTLSIAPHFCNPSTPVIARFSVGGGFPVIRDTDNQATPKGLVIRFQISEDIHTDLVAHTFDGFATRNGEDFLTFLRLLGAVGKADAALKKAKEENKDTTEEQAALDQARKSFGAFLETHPPAKAFFTSVKPNPHDYGTIVYYQPNTHILTNAEGKETNVRYRLIPQDGVHLYDSSVIDRIAESYLEIDLLQRFPIRPIVFTIKAHIADPEDVLDDATVPYKSTTFVDVGRLEINKVSDDNDNKQQQIAFSPTPEKGGVQGIRASNDPLIQTRRGVYGISAGQRRNEEREVQE